jgi:TetR/AcrR family transcriptional regulator, mexJK operon transcriptional repressor
MPAKPRRGRPTKEQVEKINKAILTAATRRFLSDGFDATAMEVVASDAKVSKGTLYARYSTKEALFRAVVEDRVESWSAQEKQRDHLLTDDLKQRLIHHSETVITFMGHPEVVALDKLVRSSAHLFPEVARAIHEIGYAFSLRMFTEEIAKGTAADAVPARNPERVAETLLGALSGWHMAQAAVREVPVEDARAFARDAVELVIAGRAAW